MELVLCYKFLGMVLSGDPELREGGRHYIAHILHDIMASRIVVVVH